MQKRRQWKFIPRPVEDSVESETWERKGAPPISAQIATSHAWAQVAICPSSMAQADELGV